MVVDSIHRYSNSRGNKIKCNMRFKYFSAILCLKENFVVGVQFIEGEPQGLQLAAFYLPTACEKSLLRGMPGVF